MALPYCSPGKKAHRIAPTCSRQPVRSGPGAAITTIVLGCSAATASISASCGYDWLRGCPHWTSLRLRLVRS